MIAAPRSESSRTDSVHEVAITDGHFTLEDVGASRFELFMFNERGHVGPVDIDVGAPSGDIGTLAFHPWAGASVRVIDAVTRAPIADASVMTRPEGLGWQVDALEEPVLTDSSGIARPRFPSLGGALHVEALGYSDRTLTDFEWEAGVAAFGTVELQRTALVDVQLVGSYDEPTWWQLDDGFEREPDPVRFDATAAARIEADRGSWSIGLLDPTGREERLEFFDAIEGDLVTVEWPVAAGTIDIDFVGATEEQLEARRMHTLELDWESELGYFSRELKVGLHLDLPDVRAIPMDGVVDGAIDWTLKDPEGLELAWGRATFPLDGPQRLVVDLSHGAATLEVTDASGAPVEDALVLAFDEAAVREGGYIRQLFTDADGRQRLPLLEPGRLGVVVIGPDGAVVPELATRDWTPGTVERVVLDGIGSVRARVSAGRVDGLAATSEDAGAGGAGASDAGSSDAGASGAGAGHGNADDADSSDKPPGTSSTTPLPNAKATVFRDDTALWLVECEADGDGLHTYDGLAAADYVLRVTADGHWRRDLPFTVAGATAVTLDAVLPPLADLAVQVVDAEGEPVAGRALGLVHTGLDESVAAWIAAERLEGADPVTDADGRVRLTGVPAGRYRVELDGEVLGTARTDRASNLLVRE